MRAPDPFLLFEGWGPLSPPQDTIALISHTSKVMLKILQARLQQYVNHELPDVLRHESWTIKKAKHLRIDAFKLWGWRRLLKLLMTSKRSNQSVLKEINPEYSLERLILKLELQFFGHLM